jgi:SAM-dependent methyltransferase
MPVESIRSPGDDALRRSLRMPDPFDVNRLVSRQHPTPAGHGERIARELAEPDKARMLRVIQRMGAQTVPDLGSIDWESALAEFGVIDFPAYYLQPFHSVPGGYLNEVAALGDRAALEAIYEDAHPHKSLGLRTAIATLVPDAAREVIDLGGGTADGAAAIARRLPYARVTSIDASPFMVVVGRLQNGDVPNLRVEQGFAEDTGCADASVDAVAITLLLHECPDVVKREILAECMRMLRPGGTIVLSDVQQDELDTYRGFYEPYREEWRSFEATGALAGAGFVAIESTDVAPPLWTRIARKPE